MRDGFINAVQVYPFSDGALYQVYAAPGQITDIALQEGEQLVGSGPVAAGDTVRWIIGDTESGAGPTSASISWSSRRGRIWYQPRDQYRPAHLSSGAALDREDLYGLGVLDYPEDQLIALRARMPAAEAARRRDRRRHLRAELPLRDRGRQSALAAAARLR